MCAPFKVIHAKSIMFQTKITTSIASERIFITCTTSTFYDIPKFSILHALEPDPRSLIKVNEELFFVGFSCRNKLGTL